MCNAFSGIILQDHTVLWKAGMDSHDSLYELFKNDYPILKKNHGSLKFEITPDVGYLHPEKTWTYRLDEEESPAWYSSEFEKDARKAWKQWKEEVYSKINLEEVRKPINPLSKLATPAKKDIENLHSLDSVWASVWDSVWASVWASVGASVKAYYGSLFNIWNGEYKYQPCVDLWKRNLIPSFDGITWRLHSGKDAKIVYEIEASKLNG